ncbi:RNA polymerase, sigma-24 subunit, ECF subfamily [Emticicia oligotrophica DSM 17448]|uniref:RNA polymerase, sigma-24 subunit, ECF subfamily n=1 Tax=Emticicia oligotrophica (strain DSM 17448 / CIP 109782 / MTCC 6937 / GPTSA100-15) TaxID=929562 RepID=A0ABN4APZ1_EMTOG|nr:sigma-70 family RNA polymerase sigma factor [Emticicia oligotrophica]AFK04444.1 RNA polymerase, sigma-24 subunit, ECF subfamily [Emticicia oligotrophica DSM 17448]
MIYQEGQTNTTNDSQLWQQLKNGSELALGKLIKKYFNPLLNYGYKFVRNEDFVKDCVQEVFVEIWSRRQNISQPDSVRAYLLSSVRKKILRESFRQKIKTDGDEIVNIENDLKFAEFSPELAIIEQENSQETIQKISSLLNTLPKRQREVIYLRFYQNLERDEIAQIMGVNAQSVSNLLQAAFKTIRENWSGLIIHYLFLIKFIS